MITIRVGNSTTQALGLDTKTFALLRKTLSYTPTANKSYFSGKAYNQRRYLIDKKGWFPTGLLYLAKSALRAANAPFTIVDTRITPTWPFKPKVVAKLPFPPHPWQTAAAAACRAANRGIVVAPTGSGKSIALALIIEQLQARTLIVVPSLELRHQITEGLKEVFGAQKVGRLKDNRHIAVENVAALKMKPLVGYDCVIIDEFHRSGAATYQRLNKKSWGGVYFRFGTTATPFRSDENERLLLESVLSDVVYRLTYAEAVKHRFIVPIEAYYVDLPKRAGNDDTWQAAYKNLVVENPDLNGTIGRLLTALQDESTLTLVKELKHGRNILNEVPDTAVFANGQDGECQEFIKQFNSGEIKTLIGTVGVLGEGVDTKPAEWVIIACGGKSKNSFMQWCGRGVRRYKQKESCKVILFRYAHNKWLRKHFAQCVKYLRDEYGVAPVKLEV